MTLHPSVAVDSGSVETSTRHCLDIDVQKSLCLVLSDVVHQLAFDEAILHKHEIAEVLRAFGNYLDPQITSPPVGYLRRLLSQVKHNIR